MSIIASNQNLPTTADELSRFVLVGRERLNAVRALIRAIDKVGVAADVYQQKLAEGQEIAEAVLDAEVKLGEPRSQVPRDKGGRPEKTRPNGRTSFDTPKQQFDTAVGLGRSTMSDIEKLSTHPDIVERVKAEAREAGEIVTRQDVLKAIKSEQKAVVIEKAKADIDNQTKAAADAPTLYVGDSVGFKTNDKVDIIFAIALISIFL